MSHALQMATSPYAQRTKKPSFCTEDSMPIWLGSYGRTLAKLVTRTSIAVRDAEMIASIISAPREDRATINSDVVTANANGDSSRSIRRTKRLGRNCGGSSQPE